MSEEKNPDYSNDSLYKIRHSLAHVMAQAVLQIRPKAKLAFGPPIENGFYYDFDLEQPISPEELPDIEERMRKIILEKQEFIQQSRTPQETLEFFEASGEIYKHEYAQELLSQGETELGFYTNGPFQDMCRGPHVKHTGELPKDCFKLDNIAGAYWRGSEKNKQLTRIYALAFASKKELEEFIAQRELAKQRDHRKLGTELELFTFEEQVGPGLALWLPNGTVIREELEKFAKEIEFRQGYVRVSTPHIAKAKLYYTSGHLPYYKEDMFPSMKLSDGDLSKENYSSDRHDDAEDYYLKPMNCPHHHLIYGTRPRSYRELPLRLAEYGCVYRYENAGALSGLLRVRLITQNDAHIYCTPEQLKTEFRSVLELHDYYYKKFRFSHYYMRLSLHDPKNTSKYIDQPEAWATSEKIIGDVLKDMSVPYVTAMGEAAFYGPKVDFQIRNVIGREESASTNQLDFAGAERFNLNFIGEDGKEHRPYIIHRAPLGSHERFVAFLLEHFGGAFPTWLSPTQVMIVPVAEKFGEYAEKLKLELANDLFRVDVDHSDNSFNKKIRNAVTHKIPNILVIGGNEVENNTVTWRRYCSPEQRTIAAKEFHVQLKYMVDNRVMDNFADEDISIK